MAKKKKKVIHEKHHLLAYAAIVVLLLGIISCGVFRMAIDVQSYSGQKGAPERPPKGAYNVVTGTVTDANGAPINRARVTTYQKTVNRNNYTDQNGKYYLEFPYCANCKSVIEYSATGYQTTSIDTLQVAGGALTQDVVLQPL